MRTMILHPDGSATCVEPSGRSFGYDELTAMLRGEIDYVFMPSSRTLVCVDDKKREFNKQATNLSGKEVFGDALVCDTYLLYEDWI